MRGISQNWLKAPSRDHAEDEQGLDEQEEAVGRRPQLPDAAHVLPGDPQAGRQHCPDADQGDEAESPPDVRPQQAGVLAQVAAGPGEGDEEDQSTDPHGAADDVDLVEDEIEHLVRIGGGRWPVLLR
ncbi:hypothetical protein GCM10020000_17980 [Streptomyces olivoverticillatus]